MKGYLWRVPVPPHGVRKRPGPAGPRSARDCLRCQDTNLDPMFAPGARRLSIAVTSCTCCRCSKKQGIRGPVHLFRELNAFDSEEVRHLQDQTAIFHLE